MADIIVAANGITIRELSGRSGSDSADNNTAERRWLVRGNSDPTVCRATLVTYAGNIGLYSYDGLSLKSMSWALYSDGGPEAWEFSASYDFTSRPEPGAYTISVDTAGGTVNTQLAYSQTEFPATGETAVDYGDSINVDAQGNPQGVEKIIPSLKINVRATIKEVNVSTALAYAKLIASLTGTVNDAAFLTFPRGELLFKGASGDIIANSDPTLNFAFEASPNITGETIGTVTGINKLGWEYIWFDFKQKQDAATSLKTTVARAAYVARVYDFGDFDDLFIGV